MAGEVYPIWDTPEGRKRIEAICRYLREGWPVVVACGKARVPRRTYTDWMAKAREADAPEGLRELALMVDDAKADGYMRHVDDARDEPKRTQLSLFHLQHVYGVGKAERGEGGEGVSITIHEGPPLPPRGGEEGA